MKPQPLQPAELFGVVLICAAAVGLACFLPGELRFVVTAVAWLVGTTLVSFGGVAFTRHDSPTTWIAGPLLAIAFTIGTALLLSSTLLVPAVILSVAHASFMITVLLQAQQRRQKAAAPARAAIRVRTETPRPVQKAPEPRGPEPSEPGISHEIDAGLERVLLSKIAVGTPEDHESEQDVEHPHEAIRFQAAESHLFQRIERGQDADGREWLEGTVRVDFVQNQKTSIVHIPFWPAFHVRPEVSSELLEGPQLTIEAKTVERWGIRLELTRRAAGLDPDFAELAFFVSTHTAAREAA